MSGLIDKIDLVNEAVQIIVLLVGIFIGFLLYIKKGRDEKYIYIVSAFICIVMGDFVYTLYLWINGEFPDGFSAADLSYIGACVFFIVADFNFIESWGEEKKKNIRTARIYAFAAACFAFATYAVMIIELYIWKYPIWNSIVYLPFILALAYYTVLCFFADIPQNKPYHFVIILLVFSDLMMSLFSSFGIDAVYIVFDCVWTLLFPFILKFFSKCVVKTMEVKV